MILADQRPDAPPVVFVATPTLGQVSMQWHLQMLDLWRLGKPMNRALFPLTTLGYEVGVARNLIVREALAWEGDHGARMSHIFFVDDDVFVQRESLIRLLWHNRPIVSALYYAKTETPQPLLLTAPYQGVSDVRHTGLVECYGHGMGCTLIRREVFEATSDPWFRTSQGETHGAEHRVHTEDVFFLEQAAAAGFQPAVDTDHVVLHYDHKTRRAFPLDLWEAA